MARPALLSLLLAAAVAPSAQQGGPGAYLPTTACTQALGNVTTQGGSVAWLDTALQARCGHSLLTEREIEPLFRDTMTLFVGNSVMRHLSETLELEIGVKRMHAPPERSAPKDQTMEAAINTAKAFSGAKAAMHGAYQNRLHLGQGHARRTLKCAGARNHFPKSPDHPDAAASLAFVADLAGCDKFDAPVANGTAALTYVYTGAPTGVVTEAFLHEWARRVANGTTAAFAGVDRVETVFLMETAGDTAHLTRVKALLDAVVELRGASAKAGRPCPRFLLMTATERNHRHVANWNETGDPNQKSTLHADLIAAEPRVIVAASDAGVVPVPVSFGTARGIESGAMRHTVAGGKGVKSSSWHFTTPGRVFIMQMAANALRSVLACEHEQAAERGGMTAAVAEALQAARRASLGCRHVVD